MNLTYQSSGVDLAQYDQAMKRLPPLMTRTHGPRVIPLTDGFAGLFRLNATTKYKDPVLVSGTDGVGTKLKVAQLAKSYKTVGIDLVAMSVNDCLCLGAEPLFFLDYLALDRDDPDLIADLVEGVSLGCQQCQVALLGGETAIMPDLYRPGDFDMAGFCVGVVEKSDIIDGSQIRSGDVVIGLPSSGFHSNGYSLIRKIVFEHAGLTIDSHVPEIGTTVREALLTPTKLYSPIILPVLKNLPPQSVSALAHITGGGIHDNVERLLPDGVHVNVYRNRWEVPALFQWLQQTGSVADEEMFKVFNMGIGFIIISRPNVVDTILQDLAKYSEKSWILGEIVAGDRGVSLR